MNRHPTGGSRLGALGQLLLSAALLLAVTVGIPWGLVASAGMPWPSPATSLPDLADRLTEPISDPLLIKLLALIAWVCWAAFMATLVREACWALRQLPTLLRDLTEVRIRLDALPTHRAAAGFLVATVVFALATMWRPVTAHAHTTTSVLRPPTAATAPAVPTPVLARTGPAERRQPAAQPSTVPYTVVPGDTLWDIARSHLGDPLRWPVIYQLNCHRIQPDGHRLGDPDQLSPGWILHLPYTATGDPTPTAPASATPAAPATRSGTQPVNPAPTPPPVATHHHGEPTPGRESRPASPAHTSIREDHRSGVRIDVGPASAIGITTAAGIAAAVAFARAHERRRRTPDLSASPLPLSEAVRAARSAHLHARHAVAVAAQQPFLDEGKPEEVLIERPFPAQPAAAGAIVCAHRDGEELSADLLAVPGGIALTGPGADAAARALAISVLSAAERLRPAPPLVRLITPAATAHRLLADVNDRPVPAWTVTRDLAEALNLAEQALLHRAGLADTADAPGAGCSHEGVPTVMDMLICDLDPQHAARLAAIAQQTMPAQLAVIVVDPDTWPTQARLAKDGTVTQTTGPAAEPLAGARMFTLSPQPAAELLHVLRAACGHLADHPEPQTPHPPPPRSEPDTIPPAPTAPTPEPGPQLDGAHAPEPSEGDAEADPPAPSQDPVPPSPPVRRPPQQAPSASISIEILGRFRIRAAEKEKEFGHGMREETREFLALLAAHPKGIRGEKIADMLRLSPDPDQAAREMGNLRRAVRRSLRQATGAQHAAFIVRVGDRDLLDRNLIATDFAAFTDAMQRARQTRDEDVRIAALREAVAAYGGPLCEGADYSWADEAREALHRQAIDTLMLLADHEAKTQPHPDRALALLDQAAEWDRYNEAVYQRIIRLQRAAGRDDAAHRTYGLLKRRLAEIGVTPDHVSTALIAPQRHPTAAR